MVKPAGEGETVSFTEALRLKQVGLLHADAATPGQEVGGVVPSEEGTWRGVPLARHRLGGEELSGGGGTKTERTVSHRDKNLMKSRSPLRF